MASLLNKCASFSLPLVPWAMSVVEGAQKNKTHLGGFSRGLGAGTLGLLGLMGGEMLDDYTSNGESYAGRILGTLLGGVGGYYAGDRLLKAHNASNENYHAIKEYIDAAEEEKQLNKQAAALGGLIGAMDPEMSVLGGATRGAGIEGGGLIGGALGAALGGLFGAHVGNWFYDDAEKGAKLGVILGGVPGALLGGKIGWNTAKRMLQEHALTPLENRDRRVTEEEE